MDNNKEYFAFISYKEEDYEMAKWLQYKLEHYHLPSIIRKKHPNLPQKIKPVFEYKSEMAGGFLKPEIKQALSESKYLIVICSPNTPQSQWVADEIQSFIDVGRADRIIPFVVAGEAYSKNPKKECFPVPLRELKEPLRGISIDELGRDAAAVKVVAQMFGLKFDMLWQRYEKEKKRKRRFFVYGTLALALAAFVVAGWMWHQKRKTQINQSRYVAEKANELIESDSHLASLLAINVLPKNLKNSFDFPYTKEAEILLRKSTVSGSTVLRGHTSDVIKVVASPDGQTIFSASDDMTIRVWDVNSGRCIDTLIGHVDAVDEIYYSPDGFLLSLSFSSMSIRMWDLENGCCVDSVCGYNVVLSPDGKNVAFAYSYGDGKDGETYTKICLSNVNGGVIQCYDTMTIKGKLSFVDNMFYNQSKDRLVTISREDTIRIWDLNKGTCINSFIGREACLGCDDKCVLSQSMSDSLAEAIFIWDIEDGKYLGEIMSPNNDYDNVHLCSDGKHVIYEDEYSFCVKDVESDDNKELYLFDIEDNGWVDDISHCHFDWNSAFFNSGSNLMAVSCVYEDGKDKKHSIYIWNLETRQCIDMLQGHSDEINSIVFMPNGENIVSSSNDMTIRVWNIGKNLMIRTLYGHKDEIGEVFLVMMGSRLFHCQKTIRPEFGMSKQASVYTCLKDGEIIARIINCFIAHLTLV